MAKNLLIVESPAKAKTIEKYLGKDFVVKSSYGHIRDLDKGKKGIDKENGFNPSYVISPEKERVVKELKTSAKKVDEVWLATDEDREGEAISWHLCEVLGLDELTTKRIVFREITEPAIKKAILEPRTVDIDLVKAQQARRILDRLVGFELSETLWRKVGPSLSAGRVQSVAVKLIVERERQINSFEADGFYKVVALFKVKNENGNMVELKADLKTKYESEEEARDFLERCKGSSYSISNIVVKPTFRKPAAPFITSTLQQEASRKLGFGVSRTMSAAQKLYEQGHISYMRTDSTNLSETALGALADQISKAYGDKYLETRRYVSKKKGAQEAHEAIRPAYADRTEISGDSDQVRLYDLIWKRTIASQMTKAELEKTNVTIGASGAPDAVFQANGEVLKFDGFLKVYMESKDDDDESEAKGILPPLSVGQMLDLDYLEAVERFTKPPARYTEATLVKKLEELGIGRPSTYAPTISKIMVKERGYVTKESREGKERSYKKFTLRNDEVELENLTEMTGATSSRLYASDKGMVVTDFLSTNFGQIMDYNFTAEIEGKLDDVAAGSEEWQKMISEFYGPFHDKVEDTIENAERAKGRRDLGVDAETGHTILVQMTRYGPVAQIGTREEVGEEGKPKFANLKLGQSIENISLEEVMELFKLPRNLGEYESKEVVIGAGRFGPYVKYDEKFISIPRDEDPLELSFDRAVVLIEEKKKEDAPIATYKGKDVTSGKGRFGPFLKFDGMFINVPRRIDPETITQEQIFELVEAKIEKEANRYIKRFDDSKDVVIEQGRWGPFIRFKKKSIKIPKIGDERITREQALEMSLEDCERLVEEAFPGSIKKKKEKAKKPKKAKK